MKEGWEYKKLGEVADFYRGLTYGKSDEAESSNVRVLRSNNIDLQSMSLNLDEIKYLKPGFVIPEDKKLKGKSIFICMSNGSKQHVGKVAYIPDDMDYAFGGFMGLIVPKGVSAKYIYYVCCSSLYREFLSSIGNGIGITNLRFSDLNNFTFPISDLKQQQNIVSELDLLSGVIEKQKAQLEELDRLAQSIFYDMFGDPVTNEKGWELRKLKELGQFGRGVSKHRPRNAPELLGGSMPLIQTGDVSNSGMYITAYSSTYSEIGVAQSKVWLAGTLCITIAANIGNCAILTFDACFPDSVVGFIANEKVALKEYVYYIFERMQSILEANAPAVAQKNINLKILDELLIPLPPLSLQQEFAAKVEAIEAMKAKVRQSLKEAETLFNERMDYYFN